MSKSMILYLNIIILEWLLVFYMFIHSSVGVVVSLVIAITRLGCRIGVALCPHFPQRWILGTRATLQNLKNKQVIKLIVLFYDSHSIDNKILNKKQKSKNTDSVLCNSFVYRHPEFPRNHRCPCLCPMVLLQYEVVNLETTFVIIVCVTMFCRLVVVVFQIWSSF